MDIFGIILMAVGFILMVASRGIVRKGLKSARKMTDNPREREEYIMLVGNAMVVLRILGFVLLIIGVAVFGFSLVYHLY